MGGFIKINDTLQITSEQGFPNELNYEKHLKKPFKAEDFTGQIFEFKDKSDIRIYHRPPVRNFLVQNIDGKWIYWGLIHIFEVFHDHEAETTSGKYKIIYINTPEEMKQAYQLIDRREDFDFFEK
ncbi:hypothetical protein K8R42_00145 [bacterium]|nr:hypothetical protein [bacterium]